MSRLYDLRRALADAIIAADIGWTADNVIIRRQADLWNDLATAIATSADGVALHIGIAEGAATPKHRRGLELTIPLTIVALPQTDADARPEEDLWEDLVDFVTGLILPGDQHSYSEFRIRSFTDVEINADNGSAMLGRQTVFEKLILLD